MRGEAIVMMRVWHLKPPEQSSLNLVVGGDEIRKLEEYIEVVMADFTLNN
jgi:hypothetical protein